MVDYYIVILSGRRIVLFYTHVDLSHVAILLPLPPVASAESHSAMQTRKGRLIALLQCAGSRAGGSWLAHARLGLWLCHCPPQQTCWLPFQLCG